MRLSRLVLTNFRNYTRTEWLPHPSNNILYGDNGHGKTNLLEAVHYLSTTRSFRTSRDRELINKAAAEDPIPSCRIEAEVERAGQKLRLELALMGRRDEIPPAGTSPRPEFSQLTGIVQKRIRVNGIPRTTVEFTGQLNAVLFSSQDIEVIGGAPASRRRYLDDMKAQVDRQYLRTLAAYNRVLEQRNHLLKLIQEGKASAGQLEFWDKEMVDKGTFLMRQRRELVEEIWTLARPLHLELTSGKEKLALEYRPNLETTQASPGVEDTKQAFAAKLKQYQPREIGAGITLVGPHRDDLGIFIDGIDLGAFGSRGQQRTVALALRLAEATYLFKMIGEAPVILLDDVLSELDAQRRGFIMKALPGYGQVISTATELDRFEQSFLAGGGVFHVVNGTVTPE